MERSPENYTQLMRFLGDWEIRCAQSCPGRSLRHVCSDRESGDGAARGWGEKKNVNRAQTARHSDSIAGIKVVKPETSERRQK